ncbi:MAG: hypothetical protein HC767_00935 [Akkermansiaceae bacterium]|nr:hypothetical protein [Akkermansiaceae bacterium]
MTLDVQNARELTAKALVGASGSILSLQDSTMLMPKEVRIPASNEHLVACAE